MSTSIYDIFRQFLCDNDCEEQFDKAFYEQCGANVLDENLSDILVIDETFLNRCFDWKKTIEGRDFWKTIDELWWKMYLQIAKAMKNHPKIDSILKKIDKGMSDEDKQKILAQSKSDFTIGQHWGLEAWVRTTIPMMSNSGRRLPQCRAVQFGRRFIVIMCLKSFLRCIMITSREQNLRNPLRMTQTPDCQSL